MTVMAEGRSAARVTAVVHVGSGGSQLARLDRAKRTIRPGRAVLNQVMSDCWCEATVAIRGQAECCLFVRFGFSRSIITQFFRPARAALWLLETITEGS